MNLPTTTLPRLVVVLLAAALAGATAGCATGDAPSSEIEETAASSALVCGGEGDRCRDDADCCGSGPGWELVCRRRRCAIYIYDYCQLDPSACNPCTLHPEDPSCL